jgi:hypothetical protein
MDGTAAIEDQQKQVRSVIVRTFDLPRYRWRTQV